MAESARGSTRSHANGQHVVASVAQSASGTITKANAILFVWADNSGQYAISIGIDHRGSFRIFTQADIGAQHPRDGETVHIIHNKKAIG